MAGETLCAWPGCPMGRGWDEPGEKGALIVTLDDSAHIRFVSLGTPQFHDISVEASEGVASVLPAVANDHFYRVTLIGEAESIDLAALQAEYSQFPNLLLRDHTRRPVDLWKSLGEDSFEGVYFGMLKDALAEADPQMQEQILLAAKLSRQILDGQEVALP